MAAIFLALMGIGFVAAAVEIFSDDDGSDSQSEAETEDPGTPPPDGEGDEATGGEGDDAPEDVLGIALMLNESPLIEGTEGDDTLAYDQDTDEPEQTSEVRLLGGDDLAEVDDVGLLIDGGEGDDTIASTGQDSTLIGGSGDDVIAASAAFVDAGSGDDQISYDLTGPVFDAVTDVQGGEGTDSISIVTEIGDNPPDWSSVNLNGGAGQDTFDVTLNMTTDDEIYAPEQDPIISQSGVVIGDFDPEEDLLTVRIAQDAESAGRDLLSTELEQDPRGNSLLVLTFAATETLAETQTSIRLGTLPVTLDDIVILAESA